MEAIRILIADDSVVNRQRLRQCLEQEPEFQVVALAADGKQALEKVAQYQPDLVILDIEMPELNGLQVLRRIRADFGSLPVIMFSTLTETGAAITIQALKLGADDYVTKPGSGASPDQAEAAMREAFRPRILALHRKARLKKSEKSEKSDALVQPTAPRSLTQALPQVLPQVLPKISPQVTATFTGWPQVIGIGISTGGPRALETLLAGLKADFPVPILVVQHMPPVFTRYLAEGLNEAVPLRVLEAEAGMPVKAGEVYIAPGNWHLLVTLRDGQRVLSLSQTPPENSCRPAVDVLFRSLAEAYGPACLGLVMTGMGHDGLTGSAVIHAAGGKILAQDEASSTVWSMPREVVKAGLADKVLSLSELAPELTRRCR